MAKTNVSTHAKSQTQDPDRDPVLLTLAHTEPHILAGLRVPNSAHSPNEERAFDGAHDAALALALSIPATSLLGLAGQIAALQAVLDWEEVGADLSIYTRDHVQLGARLVARFLTSAATTLAGMGACPPPLLAEYAMGEVEAKRLALLAVEQTPKGEFHA